MDNNCIRLDLPASWGLYAIESRPHCEGKGIDKKDKKRLTSEVENLNKREVVNEFFKVKGENISRAIL